jgi:hypothetical protein
MREIGQKDPSPCASLFPRYTQIFKLLVGEHGDAVNVGKHRLHK